MWVVSGSLSGSYSNNVSWVNCPETGASGTAHESATLNVKIRPGHPSIYEGTGIDLLMHMTPGGSWSVSGSYPPRIELPEDAIGCGSQQAIHCGGPIVSERGGGEPQFVLVPKGRRLVGAFYTNDFFKESITGEDCNVANSAAGPLLGLGETEIEPDVFGENSLKPANLSVPRARFAGHAPFAISESAGPDGGCTPYYTQCQQSGRLTLTLRFRRVH